MTDKNGNKIIDWDQFCELPLIGSAQRRDKVFHISEGDEVVSYVKSIVSTIGIMRYGGEGRKVDFLGCSPEYIIEKIRLAINDLKWLEQRTKEISREAR